MMMAVGCAARAVRTAASFPPPTPCLPSAIEKRIPSFSAASFAAFAGTAQSGMACPHETYHTLAPAVAAGDSDGGWCSVPS